MWVELIENYDFILQYLSSKANVMADGLSKKHPTFEKLKKKSRKQNGKLESCGVLGGNPWLASQIMGSGMMLEV